MSKHLERDLESLEQDLLAMSALVESMIVKAWRSLDERDPKLAEEVIATDDSVDSQEVRIEESCLKILALHQPVAIDLRRTAIILKVNNDLERIADLAVNIAQSAQRMSTGTPFQFPASLRTMAQLSRRMLADALSALVRLSPEAAQDVCLADDRVDQCHAEFMSELYTLMRNAPDAIAPAIHCLAVGRHLERMADLATNIAEDVVYLVRGDIARHRRSITPVPVPNRQ